MDTISILAALDEHYLPQLHVLLTSLRLNNPGEHMDLYLLQSAVSPEGLAGVERQCAAFGYGFFPVLVDDALFQGAPVSRQYPKEMYYRLLAPHLLPSSLHRVLYLDPDILVINPLTPLWETELQGNLFAAASHTTVNDLVNGINRIRLKTDQDYYNTGVLLMDLDRGRTDIHPQEIFQHVQEHGSELLLPDQDVFNTLYGAKTLWIDDALWNYDARYYPGYLLRSNGAYHMDWVMQNTAILHFCGKRKPWKKAYAGRFATLYKHYNVLAHRNAEATPPVSSIPK